MFKGMNMKYYYDFHIHTAASPCAEEHMTPNNIINMCDLKGLQMIAVTDHQIAVNCQPIMSLGNKKGIYVFPGIEIECMEEFHLIALFENIESANDISQWLLRSLPPIKNRVDLFGHQYEMNEQDEVLREIPDYLLGPSSYSCEQIVRAVHSQEGIIYPAHVDRLSYSLLMSLGTFPPELNFRSFELSSKGVYSSYQKRYPDYQIVQSSDAHHLGQISEKEHFLEMNIEESFSTPLDKGQKNSFEAKRKTLFFEVKKVLDPK